MTENCFRVGEIWRSPRLKDWKVEKIHPTKGAFLRAMHNSHTTQWRKVNAVGNDMMNAWMKISLANDEEADQ